MDPIDLRNIVTYFPPQSAYDVLSALCDQVGARSVRDALIQIQADKIIKESHAQDEDPRPYNGTIITPPTLEDAVLRPIDKDAELWAINRELVQAGLKPWQYETFAACVAELRRRAERHKEEFDVHAQQNGKEMIFVIQTNDEVAGLDIANALSGAGISHTIISKTRDEAAKQRRAERPEEEIISLIEYVESDIETGVQMNTEEWERTVKTVREWLKE